MSMTSIRIKLIAFSALILLIAFFLTLMININILEKMSGVFSEITESNSKSLSSEMKGIFESNKDKIKGLIEKQLTQKGASLIQEGKFVILPAFRDSSFTFINEILFERVNSDEDIIYSSFFTSNGDQTTLWTLSKKSEEIGSSHFGAMYDVASQAWLKDESLQIKDPGILEIVKSDKESVQRIKYEVKSQNGDIKIIDAYEVSLPLMREEDGAEEESAEKGYLRYVISLETMNSMLAAEEIKQAKLETKNQEKLAESLMTVKKLGADSYSDSVIYLSIAGTAFLFFSICCFYFLATRITVPLLQLKESALQIASGNYEQSIAVVGRDEVGVLASSFEQMRAKVKMFTDHLQSLVDQRTKELREALGQVTEEKSKIQEILTHIDQGILMLDSDLRITDQYSEHVKRIFSCDESHFVGVDATEFLFGQMILQNEASIRGVEALAIMMDGNRFTWTANKSHLLRETSLELNGNTSILAFNWHPIFDDDGSIRKIIVSFMDVTQKKALEREINLEKERSRRLFDIISVVVSQDLPDVSRFFERGILTLEDIHIAVSTGSQKDRDWASWEIHTLKGNARMFGFDEIAAKIHHLESLLRENSDETSTEILSLGTLFSEYRDVIVNVLKVSTQDKQHTLFSLMHTRSAEILKRLATEGMQLDGIACEDGVIAWPPEIIPQVGDILTHSIMNSLDHGYIRPAQGGAPKQRIRLSISAIQNASHIILRIKDWGQGINYDKLRLIASQRKLPFSTVEELNRLLFAQQLSTADSVSLTSGRGDGLTAVHALASSLQGRVEIANSSNESGTVLTVEIPRYIRDGLSKQVS